MDELTFTLDLGYAVHSVKTALSDEIFFWSNYPFAKDRRDVEMVQWIELGTRAMAWKEQVIV